MEQPESWEENQGSRLSWKPSDKVFTEQHAKQPPNAAAASGETRIVQVITGFMDTEPRSPGVEIQELTGGEKLVSVGVDDFFRKFGSRGNEENTATLWGKLGSGEVFLKMREITACPWVEGNDLVDTVENSW